MKRLLRIVELHVPAERAYEAWRRVEDFSRVLPNVRSVHTNEDGTTDWDVCSPLPWHRLRWRAEVTADASGSRLCWRSTQGDVRVQGQVEFIPADGGCVVMVVIEYAPPLGFLGRAAARLAGIDHFIERELTLLLSYIENGSAPGEPERRRHASRRGRSRELVRAPHP